MNTDTKLSKNGVYATSNGQNTPSIENISAATKSTVAQKVKIEASPQKKSLLFIKQDDAEYELLKRGGLVLLCGTAKSGKSQVSAAIASAFLAHNKPEINLGFSCSVSKLSGRVLYLDTEQYEEDAYEHIDTICGRAGVKFDDEKLSYHQIIFLENATKLALLRYELLKRDVKLAIIDGAAEFIDDVNNLSECKRLVTELLKIAHETGVPIICVVHENQKGFSGRGARGHLGSELERKCSFCASVERSIDTNKTAITFDKLRKSYDKPPVIQTHWNGAVKRLEFSHFDEKVTKPKRQKPEPKYGYKFWVELFGNEKELTLNELYNRFEKADKGGSRRMIKKRGIDGGFIRECAPDIYCLV